MSRCLFLLLMLCAATAAAAIASPGTVRGQHYAVRLLFEASTIAPGRSLGIRPGRNRGASSRRSSPRRC